MDCIPCKSITGQLLTRMCSIQSPSARPKLVETQKVMSLNLNRMKSFILSVQSGIPNICYIVSKRDKAKSVNLYAQPKRLWSIDRLFSFMKFVHWLLSSGLFVDLNLFKDNKQALLMPVRQLHEHCPLGSSE